MTLRSLDEHNEGRLEAHAAEQDSKPTGIACPADNCTGELHCPPPFAEFEPESENEPPRVATVCPECEYTGFAYV